MPESGAGLGDVVPWLALAAAAVLVAAAVFFWVKGRPIAVAHVFRASRFSRGNFLLPTQVGVTPTSVIHYKPELVGGREHSMHIAHVASVMIDRNLFFSNVLIESTGGTSPVRCYGHRKSDAIEMKRLIEEFQSAYYGGRGRAAEPGQPA